MFPVLFVSSGLSGKYGGSAFSEATLTSALRKTCDVRLLCRRDRLDAEFARSFDCPSVMTFGKWEPLLAWLFPWHSFHEMFQGREAAHINGHWNWQNYFISRLCRRKQIAYLLHPRGMMLVGHRRVWLKKLFNLLMGNRMVKDAKAIIALSEFEKRHFTPYFIQPGRVKVIPNGIRSVKTSGAKDGQSPYFLYLGRLEARKNLLFLIEAFAAYVKDGGNAFLKLMGPVERGYDDAIRAKASQAGVAGQVVIVPPEYGAEKWRTVGASLAVIYPSVEEAFGRVPFEALSAGTLTIVPRDSGSAEYLAPFLSDCIYQDGDLASLTKALRKTGGQERKSLEPNLKSAHDWVETELAPEKISARVLNLYLASKS